MTTDFLLYIRDEYFNESEEEESEHEEIDKHSKDEEEHMLCRMFEGWMFYCYYNESIKIELDMWFWVNNWLNFWI